MSTLSAPKYPSKWLKAILFAGFATVLVWEITSRTLVAFLANFAPEQALYIRSQQSTALLNLAQKKLDALGNSTSVLPDETVSKEIGASGNAQEHGSESGPGNTFPPNGSRVANRANSQNIDRPGISHASHDAEVIEQVRRMAEEALLGDPLCARALRILGQIADLAKDESRSWQFMQASARHSLNETLALVWLMGKSAERQDHLAAARYADVLLRTRPQLGNDIAIPVLARIAEDRVAAVALKNMLSKNPPWRAQFFDALPNSITDARTPLDLLMGVRHSPWPPTAAELRSYLNFLIQRKFYALAYYTWLQFLPLDQLNGVGLVFNGAFEAVPSGLPFDWLITPGAGVTVDIDTDPDGDGNRALFVRFDDGRVDFGRIAQLIMLAPARYRLEATYKGTLLGQRGLRWRVTCAGEAAAAVGESGMIEGMSSAWKTAEFSFSVPTSNCPAQYLHLDLDARMASEQFVSGTIWFDNLQISRIDDAEK